MKLNLRALASIVVFSSLSFPAFSGCNSGGAQTVQPSARGQRGESCQARNDCEPGLACVNFMCVKNEFDISAEAKQCDLIQCQTTEDCCGDRPTEAPARCADRDRICSTPTIPGCLATTCTSNDDCNGGTCATGICSNLAIACTSNADCAETCDTALGECVVSGLACEDDTSCVGSGTCTGRICSCANPDYDPLNEICSDPDCVNICTLACEEERCVVDTSCESDADCSILTPHCKGGRCVECTEDEHCDEANDEACVQNVCRKPCTVNEECPLFYSCDAGECVYRGCTSDRECVLALGGNGAGGDDSRLAKCLPSDADPAINTCKIPCENDAACGKLQICEAGYCKFVGCQTDEECRAYLGIENEQTSPTKPYVNRAVCR